MEASDSAYVWHTCATSSSCWRTCFVGDGFLYWIYVGCFGTWDVTLGVLNIYIHASAIPGALGEAVDDGIYGVSFLSQARYVIVHFSPNQVIPSTCMLLKGGKYTQTHHHTLWHIYFGSNTWMLTACLQQTTIYHVQLQLLVRRRWDITMSFNSAAGA